MSTSIGSGLRKKKPVRNIDKRTVGLQKSLKNNPLNPI